MPSRAPSHRPGLNSRRHIARLPSAECSCTLALTCVNATLTAHLQRVHNVRIWSTGSVWLRACHHAIMQLAHLGRGHARTACLPVTDALASNPNCGTSIRSRLYDVQLPCTGPQVASRPSLRNGARRLARLPAERACYQRPCCLKPQYAGVHPTNQYRDDGRCHWCFGLAIIPRAYARQTTA